MFEKKINLLFFSLNNEAIFEFSTREGKKEQNPKPINPPKSF